MDTCVVSISSLLWIMLQWIGEYKNLFKILILILLDIYPEVRWLYHMVVLFLIVWGTLILFHSCCTILPFSKEDLQMANRYGEKMLNIDYQENANENYNEISHLLGWLLQNTHTHTKDSWCWQECEEIGIFIHSLLLKHSAWLDILYYSDFPPYLLTIPFLCIFFFSFSTCKCWSFLYLYSFFKWFHPVLWLEISFIYWWLSDLYLLQLRLCPWSYIP